MTSYREILRLCKLFSPSARETSSYKEPDFAHIQREIGKSRVTLSLLWSEYCVECRQSGEIPYMYSTFCDRYREYSVRNKATMHIERRPKDKPSVEGAVGVISTWIIAALRNWKFFSLRELNEAIRGKLEKFHQRPFQKREGSRLSVFLEEEKPLLLPLPPKEFEFAHWKICTAACNYHISVNKMFYSVPYEYIKKRWMCG